MRFKSLITLLQKGNCNNRSPLFRYKSSRSFSQLHLTTQPPSFGIAFDIDGVILRGHTLIGNSAQAIRRLYGDSGTLKIPFLFLTNGGGIRESKRALELSKLLGAKISTSQVLQGHTPFKDLVNRFENELIVAVGKGEPAKLMSEYGFKDVFSIEEYASYFDNIDPLAPYKNWTTNKEFSGSDTSGKISRSNVVSDRVQAVFIVSDSVDWSRDVQVLCDILRTGGLPGREIAHQPPLYFAHDDLKYQAEFPSERFGMGAFRIALESVYNSVHPRPLEYTCFGKPNPFVFKNAEVVLKHLRMSCHNGYDDINEGNGTCQTFKTLYMIGDNPSVDIKGAQQAGYPWFSILTRTGVFKGEGNHEEFPADCYDPSHGPSSPGQLGLLGELVVDTVADAVDFILKRECTS